MNKSIRFSFFKGDQAFAAKIHPGHAVHQEDHRVTDWQVSEQQNRLCLLLCCYFCSKAILGSTFNGLIGMTNMSTFLDLMPRVPLNLYPFKPVWNILKNRPKWLNILIIPKKDENLYFLNNRKIQFAMGIFAGQNAKFLFIFSPYATRNWLNEWYYCTLFCMLILMPWHYCEILRLRPAKYIHFICLIVLLFSQLIFPRFPNTIPL